jgi:hypothetical protein
MTPQENKKSQTRLLIAGALFLASIASSFLIAYLSRSGDEYWVLTQSIPRGVSIESGDLTRVQVSLGSKATGYVAAERNPIGSITRRNLNAGEILNINDLTTDSRDLTTETLSISVRSADISHSVNPGDIVSLFHVHDSRNGEEVSPPYRILSNLFVQGINQKSANFGGDISLTLSINKEDIPTLLSATSSGRIVVVTTRG